MRARRLFAPFHRPAAEMYEVPRRFRLRQNHRAPPLVVLTKSKLPWGCLSWSHSEISTPRPRRSSNATRLRRHYRRPSPFPVRCGVPKHPRNASAGRAGPSGARSGGRCARHARTTSHDVSVVAARAAGVLVTVAHPAPPPRVVASPSTRGTPPQTRLCLPTALRWPTREIGIGNLTRLHFAL